VYSIASDFTRHIHETTGILIFVIVLARIFWRTIDAAPEAPPMEPWMKYFAKLAHLALYALLITLPLTAIVGAWLEGHPLTLLDAEDVGPLLPQLSDIGQAVSYVHTILGNVIDLGCRSSRRCRVVPSFRPARPGPDFDASGLATHRRVI
jgi:cytochrome b561